MEGISDVAVIIIILLILYCLHKSNRLGPERRVDVRGQTIEEEQQEEPEIPDSPSPPSANLKSKEVRKPVQWKIEREDDEVIGPNVAETASGTKEKLETGEQSPSPESPESSSQHMKADLKDKRQKQAASTLQHKIETEESDEEIEPNVAEDSKTPSGAKTKIEKEDQDSVREGSESSSQLISADSKEKEKAQGTKYISTLQYKIGSAEKDEMVAPNKVQRSKIESRSAQMIQVASSRTSKKAGDEMATPALVKHGKAASPTKMKMEAEEQQPGLIIPERSPPPLSINRMGKQEKQDARYVSTLHHTIGGAGKGEIVAPNMVKRSQVASRAARVVQLTSISQRGIDSIKSKRGQQSPGPADSPTSETDTKSRERRLKPIQKTDAYKFFEQLEKDSSTKSDKKKKSSEKK